MIAVNRERRDCNGCRICPGQSWFDRAAAATDRVTKGGCETGSDFRDDVYGSDSVRSALRELFFNKCGYCESSLLGGEMDVDHYRPKAGVAKVPAHDGYYWLAYEWDNLLASCVFCNRLRKEPAMWPNKSRGETSGKGNAFPITDERYRAWCPSDDLSLENPLIINPTADDPSEHIAFDPLGRAFGITRKGEESIQVFGLNTRGLYTQRADVIEDVSCLLKQKAEVQEDSSAVEKDPCIAGSDCRIRRRIHVSKAHVAAGRAVLKNPAAFGVVGPKVGA